MTDADSSDGARPAESQPGSGSSDLAHESEVTQAQSRSLLEAWMPEAGGMLARLDQRLGQIESALTGSPSGPPPPMGPDEDGLVLVGAEPAPAPAPAGVEMMGDDPAPDIPWIEDSLVVMDDQATASGVWADEGLVVVGGETEEPAVEAAAPLVEVPQTAFDDVFIEADPTPEELLSSPEAQAGYAEGQYAQGGYTPGQYYGGYGYAEGGWDTGQPFGYAAPSAETNFGWPTYIEDAAPGQFSEAIPESPDLLAALDSAFSPEELTTMIDSQIMEIDAAFEPLSADEVSFDEMSDIAEPEFAPAKTLFGYDVFGSPVGAEGFIEYDGVDPDDRTEIKIRVLDRNADAPGPSMELREALFERERAVAAQVCHPSFPRLVEVGQQGEDKFFVYESVLGQPLSVLSLAWRPEDREWYARRVARSVAEGLQYLHDRQFVYADLSIEKILVTPDILCRFIDITKTMVEGEAPHPDLDDGSTLLAPEVNRGAPFTAKADQFALGVVLYQIFAGKPPWDGPVNPNGEPPPDLEHVNPLLAAITMKMLALDPNDRFDNCEQVARLLTQLTALDRRSAQEEEDDAPEPLAVDVAQGSLSAPPEAPPDLATLAASEDGDAPK